LDRHQKQGQVCQHRSRFINRVFAVFVHLQKSGPGFREEICAISTFYNMPITALIGFFGWLSAPRKTKSSATPLFGTASEGN
jgi:hypothetical protein